MFDLNPQFHNKPVEKYNHKFTNWTESGFNSGFGRSHGNHIHRFNNGGGPGGGGGGVAVQFRLETMEEDSSRVCSPPLWRSTGSPPESPVHRSFNNNNPRLLSPASRAQAIARGQREIMEMVESMPETSYELSLKDMVEQRRDLTEAGSVDETQSVEEGEERSILRGRGDGQTDSQRWRKSSKKGNSVKRQESNKTGRIIVKNGSMNNNKGLFINMFFPFSIGSKKKKTTKSFTTSSSFGNNSYQIAAAKLSPKVELLDKSGGKDGDRRDWWWKKFTGSSDGESLRVTSSSSSGGESTGRSGSSGSSGSSTAGSLHSNSIRNNSDCSYGCWSFFHSKKKIVKLRHITICRHRRYAVTKMVGSIMRNCCCI